MVIVVKKNGKGPKWFVLFGKIQLPVSHMDRLFNPLMHEEGFLNQIDTTVHQIQGVWFPAPSPPSSSHLRPLQSFGAEMLSAPECVAPEVRAFGPGQ